MSKPRAGEAEKQRRKEEGDKRNAAWVALTPAQQLKDLNDRLGVGVGAKRQREKLNANVA